MNIYGRGIEDIDGGEDLYFVEEKTEAKQGGFQPRIDFKNKFSWMPFCSHLKASPKLMCIGKRIGYGITENAELLGWWNEEDKQGSEKSFIYDLKAVNNEPKDGIIGKTANLLSFGKERQEIKKLTVTNMYTNNRGDLCIITTAEGENILYSQKAKSADPLPKLKRNINALKFIDAQSEDDRASIKFICSTYAGIFSAVTVDVKYKNKEKGMSSDYINVNITDINSSKANALITRIDVGPSLTRLSPLAMDGTLSYSVLRATFISSLAERTTCRFWNETCQKTGRISSS